MEWKDYKKNLDKYDIKYHQSDSKKEVEEEIERLNEKFEEWFNTRHNLNDKYFAFPEWIIKEYKEQFDFRDNEIYLDGIMIIVYPNEFKG